MSQPGRTSWAPRQRESPHSPRQAPRLQEKACFGSLERVGKMTGLGFAPHSWSSLEVWNASLKLYF